MTAKLFALATMLACIGLMHAPAAANLVQNGDFATGDLTGWSALNLSITGNYGGHVTQILNGPEFLLVTHSDIGFAVAIPTDEGFGAITQALITVPGQSYRVRYLVRQPSGPDLVAPGQLAGAGAFVAIFSGIAYMGANPLVQEPFPPFPPLPPGSPIKGVGLGAALYLAGTYNETFFATATSNTTVLEFASNFEGEFFITNISVDPVPGPPTSFLFAAGLLAIWMSVRRGQTKHRSFSLK